MTLFESLNKFQFMTNKETETIKFKLNLVLDSLRNQNSGADIHEVGNIRQTAMSLMDVICSEDSTCISDERIRAITTNVENKCVDFFKKKYGGLVIQKSYSD